MPDPQDAREPRDERHPQDVRHPHDARRPRDARRDRKGEAPAPPSSTNRPWRTEGLPDKKPPQRPRWAKILLWVAIGWLALFAITTFQDLSTIRTTPISYTAFTEQVHAGNVKEVFARGQTIQGVLKNAAPDPAGKGTYTEFATERPIFAQDDLLGALEKSDTVVRATPVAQQRGILSNLLISLLPIALLIGFYVWFFRRQTQGMGGMLGRGRKPKRVEPGDVRVTFADVAGIDEVKSEISEIVDFLKDPDKYRRLGARVPKGVLLDGRPGHRQDPAGPGHRRRGQRALLLRQRLGVHRDDRRRRRLAGCASCSRRPARWRRRSSSSTRSTPSAGRAAARAPWAATTSASRPSTRSSPRWTASPARRASSCSPPPTAPTSSTRRCSGPGRFDRKITVSPPDQKGREQILGVHTAKVPLAAGRRPGRGRRAPRRA